jgi:hypothetical protein
MTGVSRQARIICCAAVLGACSGAAPAPDPTAQTALFRFNLSDMVRNGNLPRPPVGAVYGTIYASEDVSISGPRSGATDFGDVTFPCDLRNGISDGGFTTPQLAPGNYTFLGSLDTDDDGGSHDPNPGDIVTLPTTNQFTIVDGGPQLHKTIILDLVYN